MSKICLIVPYFGSLPKWFSLYLESCRMNKRFNWLIITDDRAYYDYPDNVELLYYNFEDFVTLVQSKFDFEISLKKPYKLCDFKPAYGFIFEEHLQKYEYWGYCDIDLIWGDIDSIFEGNKYNTFDKIGHLGHLSIIKNTPELRKMFMNEIDEELIYKKVFTSDKIWVFDEWGEKSINNILLYHRKKIKFLDDICDIYPYRNNFREVFVEPITSRRSFGKGILYTVFSNGKLSAHFFCGGSKDIYYIHLQKRNMLYQNVNHKNQSLVILNDRFTNNCQPIKWKLRIKYLIDLVVDKRRFLHQFDSFKYYIAKATYKVRKRFK